MQMRTSIRIACRGRGIRSARISAVTDDLTARNGISDGNRSAFQPTTNAIVMLETSAPNKKAVFLHEMAHQFGAIDHYHNLPEDIEGDDLCSNRPYCSTCGTGEDKYTLNPYDPSTKADDETCVMETNNHSNFIETCNSVFCTHCIDDIRDHIPTMPW